MHDAATIAEMRRLYYGEHWKIGTIAAQLQVHPDAIRRAVNRPMGPPAPRPPRPRQIDPFLPWLRQTLATYPRLRATVLHRMLRERGYTGGVVQLRRLLRQLRPPAPSEAFGRLQCLPGEEGQVDWADFGCVQVGRAKRRLSAFVLTLSYSRALYAELFFDQSLSNFLAGHQHAFESFGGVPPQLLSDNLCSVVLERRGDHIRFHPRYLEWAGHYCFQPRPCHVRRGNEKGRVERSIRFLRESFWAAQGFTGLAHCNARLQRWIGEVADARPWPDDPSVRVAEVFNTCERLQLLPLPAYRLDTSLRSSVRSAKTLWIRFDRNDYSIPPQAVGRDLSLLATATEIRLFDGVEEIARHDRSYDQGQHLTDAAHTAALLKSKRTAFTTAVGSPLHCALPEPRTLSPGRFSARPKRGRPDPSPQTAAQPLRRGRPQYSHRRGSPTRHPHSGLRRIPARKEPARRKPPNPSVRRPQRPPRARGAPRHDSPLERRRSARPARTGGLRG